MNESAAPPEDQRPHAPLPGAEMATAVPLFGLALLVFNDAVLKHHWAGVVSGKLSDFGVVLYFPFLLTATLAVACALVSGALGRFGRTTPRLHTRLTRPRLLVAMALTSFALGSINVSTRARDLYLVLLDHLDVLRLMPRKGYVVDPTDLIGLTMLPVVWWWGLRLMRYREALPDREPGTPR